MHLQLITLRGISVDQDIYEMVAPTTAGEIGVFPGHEPLVTMAAPGALAVRYNKEDSDDLLQYFAIGGGVIEIKPDAIRVLVDEADMADDITEAEAKTALERAQKLKAEATNQVELEKATQLIDRQKVRLRVAELSRRRRRS
jgi:F-type H+-transporting ATPase subunit epsilon